MKEFDRWWKENTPETGGILNNAMKGIGQRTWKAALEWVLTFREPDHTDLFETIDPMWIERELKHERV